MKVLQRTVLQQVVLHYCTVALLTLAARGGLSNAKGTICRIREGRVRPMPVQVQVLATVSSNFHQDPKEQAVKAESGFPLCHLAAMLYKI
jgi:hypothetical protein